MMPASAMPPLVASPRWARLRPRMPKIRPSTPRTIDTTPYRQNRQIDRMPSTIAVMPMPFAGWACQPGWP